MIPSEQLLFLQQTAAPARYCCKVPRNLSLPLSEFTHLVTPVTQSNAKSARHKHCSFARIASCQHFQESWICPKTSETFLSCLRRNWISLRRVVTEDPSRHPGGRRLRFATR